MKRKDKVAFITGASQGIGAALVKAYRDRNYRMVATARSIKPMNDDDVLVVPGDITDRKTAERAVCEGVARFGRIDTLVNNASIFIGEVPARSRFHRVRRELRDQAWSGLPESALKP